ncbi:hypothetical protein [Streptomyces sp. NPDC102264]|uniref:hypothetical protein n=1 Tax=Streptomyces sp. NPDC102264 TaxID=3366149 RepID=UPI0038166D21
MVDRRMPLARLSVVSLRPVSPMGLTPVSDRMLDAPVLEVREAVFDGGTSSGEDPVSVLLAGGERAGADGLEAGDDDRVASAPTLSSTGGRLIREGYAFRASASFSRSRIASAWALIRTLTLPLVKSATPTTDTGTDSPSTARASGQSRSF